MAGGSTVTRGQNFVLISSVKDKQSEEDRTSGRKVSLNGDNNLQSTRRNCGLRRR